jgi:DNA adenine methylase
MSNGPTDAALTPPLKWAGGKRWLAPRLQELYAAHRHRRLVEPFCGGLAVALALRPGEALINDINEHLINFYRWIARGLVCDIEMHNDERTYYRHRDRFNQLVAQGDGHTREAAALFYYLNRTGYNGLCRFNRQGGFNVPFGRYTSINYATSFAGHGRQFLHWQFTNVDFEALLLRHDDFIYADPPYDAAFSAYAKEGFTWSDQVRLTEWLARHPGPVLLSNHATQRIEELYRDHGFRVHFLNAPRRINAKGDRTPAKEVVALRNM